MMGRPLGRRSGRREQVEGGQRLGEEPGPSQEGWHPQWRRSRASLLSSPSKPRRDRIQCPKMPEADRVQGLITTVNFPQKGFF